MVWSVVGVEGGQKLALRPRQRHAAMAAGLLRRRRRKKKGSSGNKLLAASLFRGGKVRNQTKIWKRA